MGTEKGSGQGKGDAIFLWGEFLSLGKNRLREGGGCGNMGEEETPAL